MTDKLDEMWAALEAYQSQADEDGHGDSWRVMCRDRTEEAARAAWKAAPVGSAVEEAAMAAERAVYAARVSARVAINAQEAIDAIKEAKQ